MAATGLLRRRASKRHSSPQFPKLAADIVPEPRRVSGSICAAYLQRRLALVFCVCVAAAPIKCWRRSDSSDWPPRTLLGNEQPPSDTMLTALGPGALLTSEEIYPEMA